jgi:hypothetical protein
MNVLLLAGPFELLHAEVGLVWVEATAKKRRRRLVSEKEMIRLSVSFFYNTSVDACIIKMG